MNSSGKGKLFFLRGIEGVRRTYSNKILKSTLLDPDELTNVRRYIIKSSRLTDAEGDKIKELIVTEIQQNEPEALERNTVNNETDNTLKTTKQS